VPGVDGADAEGDQDMALAGAPMSYPELFGSVRALGLAPELIRIRTACSLPVRSGGSRRGSRPAVLQDPGLGPRVAVRQAAHRVRSQMSDLDHPLRTRTRTKAKTTPARTQPITMTAALLVRTSTASSAPFFGSGGGGGSP
jgi:hypothetical protein